MVPKCGISNGHGLILETLHDLLKMPEKHAFLLVQNFTYGLCAIP